MKILAKAAAILLSLNVAGMEEAAPVISHHTFSPEESQQIYQSLHRVPEVDKNMLAEPGDAPDVVRFGKSVLLICARKLDRGIPSYKGKEFLNPVFIEGNVQQGAEFRDLSPEESAAAFRQLEQLPAAGPQNPPGPHIVRAGVRSCLTVCIKKIAKESGETSYRCTQVLNPKIN